MLFVYLTHKYPLEMRIAHEFKHGVQFEEGRLAFKFNKQTNMFEDEYYDRTDEMEAFDAQLEGYGIMQLRNLGLDKYHRLKSKKSKLQWLKLHGYKHLKDAAINVPVSPPANVWHN